ncbi:MAG: AAA family ATPase [candidate division Zixibacteria bacterium]|nr:AAA family ATPase [candidate division Zixibacteria bacterium]
MISDGYLSLTKLAERCDLILQRGPDLLENYWDKKNNSFLRNLSSEYADKVSITNTCFCVFALLSNKVLLKQLDARSKVSLTNMFGFSLEHLTTTIMKAPWTSEDLDEFNIYTSPIALSSICRLGTVGNKEIRENIISILKKTESINKIKSAYKSIAKNISASGGVSFQIDDDSIYEPSAFLNYWCIRSFRDIHLYCNENDIDIDAWIGVSSESLNKVLSQAADWAVNEVFRQISYFHAQDKSSFVAIELAFALAASLDSEEFCNSKVNSKIVRTALEAIFTEQEPDGLWPKPHPVFHYGSRGNVYPFSFEALDAILQSRSSKLNSMDLRPFIDKLSRSLSWAEENLHINDNRDSGWRSNYLPYADRSEAWSTAAVLIMIRCLKSIIATLLHEDVLSEFGAIKIASSLTDFQTFKYDSDIGDDNKSLKTTIRDSIIYPHIDESFHGPKIYSAVLFGPPGTAKTMIAKDIAYMLGWPMISLQTGDFANDGLDLMMARAKDIFTKLGYLRNTVVFIDEVEEIIRSREDSSKSKNQTNLRSRLMTTSMLTLIQELQQKRRVLLLAATNYIGQIDPAITRPGGRFDLLLLVAPPNKKAKIEMLNEEHDRNLWGSKSDVILSSLINDTESKYMSHYQYYTYFEWKHLVRDACKWGELSEDKIVESIESRRKLYKDRITIRDDDNQKTLKEFNKSKKFIRLI